MSQNFKPGEIYWFECDQAGKRIPCCGIRNSNQNSERPFLVISSTEHNRNNDSIFALPLTTKDLGGTASVQLAYPDSFSQASQRIDGSVLFEKVCRLREKDLWPSNKKAQATLTHKQHRIIVTKTIISFQRNVMKDFKI
jgi:mRNA-degrading endonuclease toxin of MazEF toxin-antitoxin module